MKKLIYVLFLSNIIFSQIVIIPASLATAGTIATQARGDDVIGWNPANLGFKDNPEFSISFGVIPIIPIPAINVMNNAVSINWLSDYLFSGTYLDNTAKKELLDVFGDDGWEINPLAYAKILGITSGDFAFSIGAELNSNIVLPTSLLELMMYGNKFAEEVSLDKVNGSAQAVVPFSLAYGAPVKIPDLGLELDNNYFGFGVKILWGVGNAEVEHFEGGLTSFKDKVVGNGNGSIKYSNDGFGLAFDLGWALKIEDNITANLAIQNLFGFIKWNDQNTEIVEYDFDVYVEAGENFEDITDIFTGADSTYSTEGYTSDYPTNLIAGIQYDLSKNVELYLNYRQYFSDEFQYSTTPRISVASKLNSSGWFPIQFGVALGGYEKFQAGIGFGLHSEHYHFDMGLAQTGGLFNSAEGIGFSISQRIIF